MCIFGIALIFGAFLQLFEVNYIIPEDDGFEINRIQNLNHLPRNHLIKSFLKGIKLFLNVLIK